MVNATLGDEANGPLAEYSALRQEVTARLGFMHQILGFYLTAVGSIFVLSLSAPDRTYLLLMVPWISFVLCGRYMSQEYGIDRIGEYHRLSLGPRIPGGLGWEQWMSDNPRKLLILGWIVPLAVSFPGASVFALAWTGQFLLTHPKDAPLPMALLIALWAGGLAVTGLTVRAVRWVPEYRRRARTAMIALDQARTVTAIILDMDGLIIDSERAERGAWQTAAKENRCTITDEEFGLIIGATAAERKRLLGQFWSGRGENAEAYEEVAARKAELVEHEPIVQMPGFTQLMAHASAASVPLALASSTHRELVLRRLKTARINSAVFKVIVTGDDVTEPKPAPDIYLRAARRLGLPPNRCIAVEDSDNGIRAAQAAATIPILVLDAAIRAGTDLPDEVQAKAYKIFGSLEELDSYLSAKSTTWANPPAIREHI
jgi:HAD superfamily hydrolase (TIGR01509 family)